MFLKVKSFLLVGLLVSAMGFAQTDDPSNNIQGSSTRALRLSEMSMS